MRIRSYLYFFWKFLRFFIYVSIILTIVSRRYFFSRIWQVPTIARSFEVSSLKLSLNALWIGVEVNILNLFALRSAAGEGEKSITFSFCISLNKFKHKKEKRNNLLHFCFLFSFECL